MPMRNPGLAHSIIPRRTKNPSKADFAALLDSLPGAAVLVDCRDGLIQMANSSACELTSLSAHELTGLNLGTFLVPVDGKVSVGELIQKADFSSDDFALNSSNRGQIRVNLRAKALTPENPAILVQIELLDQYQQRMAHSQTMEQAWSSLGNLASSLQQGELGQVLQASLQAGLTLLGAEVIALYQASGEKLTLNQTAVCGNGKVFPSSISPADFMTLKSGRLWTSKERASTSLQRAARANGMQFLAYTPIGQVNASIGMVIASGRTIPNPFTLDILQVLSTHLTTTMQVFATTQALHTQLNEQINTLVFSNALKDQIKDNLLVLSYDLRVKDINRSAELALGYTLDEVKDRLITEILISDRSILPALEAAQDGNPVNHLDNIRIFYRSGEPFPVNFQAFPVKTKRGLEGIVILFQDTSKQESYRIRNEQLEQRALLGEVTASFAHEVRNPINNISTGLQLLELTLPGNDPNLENVHRMQNDCNRLTELIKSGLSFIKPIEYKMEELDLVGAMKNMLDRWQGRFHQHTIQYQFQTDPDVPVIEGDLRAIEQVISNLVSNSIQALAENNKTENRFIGIKVRYIQKLPELPQVELSISDNGPGIPEDIRDRIFEPFFTTRKGGTGIGLAVVKRIVTMHKGSISVDSYPGATVFRVQFPVLRKKIGKSEPSLES